MRSFLLSKIIVPLHLAIIAAYLAWVQPGPEDVASYLPLAFLSLGLVALMLLFPAAKAGEEADDARYRVIEAVRGDYFFVFGVLAFAFVLIQTLNGPRDLRYVRAIRSWEYTTGIIRGFPSCLDMLLSVQGLFTVAVVASAVLAVRNSLGRKGRRLAVELMLAVATVLGLYGLIAYAQAPSLDRLGVKLPPPPSFATFATRTEAGAYFLMNACAAFGFLFMSMVNDDENRDKFHIRFLFAAFLVCVVSALFSLSCLSISFLSVALLLLAIYTFVFVLVASPGELSLTTLAAIVILGAVAAFLHFVAYPENRLHDCTEKIFSGPWQTQEEVAERAALTGSAWRMFHDNPVGGVGASCFGIQKGFPKYVLNGEWSAISNPESNHWRCGNDFAQYLAENGAVGTILFLAPFATLVALSIARIVQVLRRGTKYKQGLKSTTATDADRIGVFDVMPPDALALFVAAGAATTLSFFVPVFGSQLNVLTWAVFLAVASMSLPKPRRSRGARR
ncbi:MAG: O-antigen ligase family protein [Kiritimatiellae bacterium]|nr:O-antigen ligase family protein [Kiritimatiellia bacterium]